ncbi:hypothetical protein [Cytophaga aurantiaca]|uniref:hypothetical protein n=1 Tax=Cytophaga aurantiaca TaxID=29530 RepID=UPI00037020F4|nr:hypothetical protein [Cytophaga aurantiaca]
MRSGYLFIIFCFLNCTNSTEEKNSMVLTDSVPSPTEYAADTLKVEERQLTADDTIAASKVVYVSPVDGEFMYESMDKTIEPPNRVDFCQYLEVLTEYPQWYKVRKGYRYDASVFYIPVSSTSSQFPASFTLQYPSFTICLKGILVDFDDDYNYVGTDEEIAVNPIVNVKKDTIFISEQFDSYQYPKLIQIIPKNKNDQFKISYTYTHSIVEALDHRSTKLTQERQNKYDYEQLSDVLPYTALSDSLRYYFRLPLDSDVSISEDQLKTYKQIMKKKYQLKDTIVNIPYESEYGDDTIYIQFTRNSKLFQYGLNDTRYIRIDRIEQGKIKESKYFVILNINGGC